MCLPSRVEKPKSEVNKTVRTWNDKVRPYLYMNLYHSCDWHDYGYGYTTKVGKVVFFFSCTDMNGKLMLKINFIWMVALKFWYFNNGILCLLVFEFSKKNCLDLISSCSVGLIMLFSIYYNQAYVPGLRFGSKTS